MIKNPNCKQCDGGCCKIFLLPEKKKDFLKRCKTFGKAWRQNLYGLIFQFFFVKKIKDPEILKNVGTVYFRDTDWSEKSSSPMTCRLITDHGCRWYWLRPNFCAGYDCEDRPQILHDLKKKTGLSLPKHIQEFYRISETRIGRPGDVVSLAKGG
jgi:hypothetical protein